MSGFSGAFSGGSWTPVLQGATTPGTFVYGTQVGSYERFGRLIVARFNIKITTVSVAPVGALTINGLPVASANVAGDQGACVFSWMRGFTLDAAYTFPTGVIDPNTAAIRLYEISSNNNGNAPYVMSGGHAVGALPEVAGVCSYRT